MKTLLRICLIFLFQPLFAQPYGNEWIDYSQSYYKFPIAEDGIYRIPYQTLANAGLPISSIDPRDFQLFARGEEIPIHVAGENDGIFNPLDYIEFFGEENDGWLDTVFYKGGNNQPNPYYSLINDTIHYYLTWSAAANPRRLQVENATDFGNYFPSPFIWKEEIASYTNTYYDGEILTSQATDPEYVPSEGYMSSVLNLGRFRDLNISTPNRYISGPLVDFEMKLSGQSNWGGQPNGDHHIRIDIGNQSYSRIFEGYELLQINQSFSPTELSGGNNRIRLTSIDDRNSAVDRTAVPYIKLTYPHTMSFRNSEAFEFLVDDHAGQNKQYLEILFFRGGANPVLYDLTNNKRLRVVQGLSDYKTLIPNSGGRKRCFIAAETEIGIINELQAVSSDNRFVDYSLQQTDTTFLIITHPNLSSEASRYANYKASQGYGVVVADINQLYDQFGFGIEKNPLAIRNFVEYAEDQWSFPISHLFLIGKSVSAKTHRRNAFAYQENLVPTFGNPSADHLLTAGLNNSGIAPLIPQGRLSAKTLSDVDAYLDKVIEYEAASQELWMKQAVHFAGGRRAFEANQLEGYLNGFANTYKAEPQGGKVVTFRKSSVAPFQTTLSDSIRTIINNGVGLMTFFGHASGTGNFDISIDSPDKLQNRGKYPFILANSCYAGNYHQSVILSTAEQYVMERNKGAIGFIANGNLGLATTLNVYSGKLYEYFSNKGYGNSMAENMKLAVQELDNSGMTPTLKSICLEMSLQGDPSLAFFAPDLPDYLVGDNGYRIIPSEVTTDLDSFQIEFDLQNMGRAVNDSISLELRQDYPNAGISDTSYFKVVKPILFEDKIRITVPVDLVSSIGNNSFTFIIDPLNEIPESSELNNRIDFDVLIRSGEILPIFPYQFSIVGSQGVSLKASTAFAFETEKNYRFQLDTTAFFNSPFLKSQDVLSTGGVLEWSPPDLQNMPDSAVYFWRVSEVPTTGNDFNWRESSFQYIPNQSGWAQDHFDQFKDNQYLFLNADRNQKKLAYTLAARELFVFNVGSPINQNEYEEVRYGLDADTRETGACVLQNGFLIAVLDSLTLESWGTPYFGQFSQNYFGQANSDGFCPSRERSESYFLFRSGVDAEMDSMKTFLNNKIPDGHYVIIYSWLDIDYSAIWNRDSTILQAIENLGSTQISNLADDYPFIFTVKKGDLSSVQEVVGDSARDRISINRPLNINSTFGQIKSTNIGSYENLNRLAYRFRSQDSPNTDSVIVELKAILANGADSLLFRSNALVVDTPLLPLAYPDVYPLLRLEARNFDVTNRTPAQLERWEVSYLEVPDLALSPNVLFRQNKDSLQEGEVLEFELAIQNISALAMDSFEVQLSLLNAQNELSLLSTLPQAPLAADSTLRLNTEFSTAGLRGKQQLIVELNPKRNPKEQHYFNNRGQFDFFIVPDRLNPLLDVTFDGKRIINREIVSARPNILISLDDENQYLAIDDTSTLAMFLTGPNGQEQLVNYQGNGNATVDFIPATLPENKAQVVYRPSFSQDGIYRLRVQAFDKSGNASGRKDYQIEFEVVNESSVTRLLNYPNPFSTSTRFVFTLTGSEVPDQVQIQIMTVTGKVVREIDQYELGPLRIGNNITEFEWDGKDDFGDQLANGIYLYRVKMRINGSNVKHRESGADQFFTKEFGKMYLLR